MPLCVVPAKAGTQVGKKPHAASFVQTDFPLPKRETSRVAILQDRLFYLALEACRTSTTGA